MKKSSETILAVHKDLQKPDSLYGLNPLEMLYIKSKLQNELRHPISVVNETLKNSYRNRL